MKWRALSPWLACACLALALFATLRHWHPVRVAGESMRPALCPGDLCLVNTSAVVTTGDIALVSAPRMGRFLHRVVKVERDGSMRTKGDANAVADLELASRANVVGPVTRVVPIGAAVERWRLRRSLRYTSSSSE